VLRQTANDHRKCGVDRTLRGRLIDTELIADLSDLLLSELLLYGIE
jgi:hypothetical protein